MTRLIVIRKFQPSDFSGVIELEKKVFNEHDPYFYMQFYETCSEGFIVAEINGIVIGYAVGFMESEKTGRIFSLAVHQKYRKLWIGSSLLKEIIDVIKKNKAEEIILEVRSSNIKAKRFYEKHGFYQTGILENYYGNGEDAFTMKLDLRS